MSAYVYGDCDVELIGNWTVSDKDIPGLTKELENCGFKSQLFERTIDGKTEYTYAIAGTDMTSMKDWINNLSQLVGQSDQYSLAMKNAERIVEYLGGEELTFTGHSLGGGMAAACAYSTEGRALTFNAAGVSSFTVDINKKAKIDAYVNFRDELNYFQTIISFLPKVDGNIHIRMKGTSVLGHSIKNFINK